jgi:hypothetical protein
LLLSKALGCEKDRQTVGIFPNGALDGAWDLFCYCPWNVWFVSIWRLLTLPKVTICERVAWALFEILFERVGFVPLCRS